MSAFTLDQLRQLIQDSLGEGESIELGGDILNTTFDDLTIDSLAVLEVVSRIQDEYRLRIPDEAVDEMKTPGDVLDYVNQRLAAT